MKRKLAIAGIVTGLIIFSSSSFVLFCLLRRQLGILGGLAVPSSHEKFDLYLPIRYFRTVAMFTVPIGVALIEFSIFKLRRIDHSAALSQTVRVFCVICYFILAGAYARILLLP